MKLCSIKPITLIMIAIKVIANILVFAFQHELFETLYPFMLFFPVWFAAFSYSITSKSVLKLILICIAFVFICILIVFITSKRNKKKLLMRMLQVLFTVEILCYFLSLLFGSFFVRNILGILFNSIIILSMQRKVN